MAHIDKARTACRCQFGGEEAFLCDQLAIADVFYAPIVRRFSTYGVKLAGEVTAYVDAPRVRPDMRVWLDDANDGHWILKNFKI